MFGNHDLTVHNTTYFKKNPFTETQAKLDYLKSELSKLGNVCVLDGTVEEFGGVSFGGTMAFNDWTYAFHLEPEPDGDIYTFLERWHYWYDYQHWNYKKNVHRDILDEKIKKSIERPVWKIAGKSVDYDGELIPDIISLRRSESGNKALYILDGKYYLLENQSGKLSGNPGIQDVVKQFVYNSALRAFINENKIGEVANCFLIPSFSSEEKTKAEQEISYGSVSYWTAQKIFFKEIPEIQVIKLSPEKIWSEYLGESTKSEYAKKVFSKIRTSPTQNYLYHNENEDSVLSPNDGKNHILTGFLRQEYFDFIKSRLNYSQDFIFYFYAADKDRRYPMHPYIDFCKKFIGCSESKDEFLRGELELLSNGRCRIDEIAKDDLRNVLQSALGSSSFLEGKTAATYYMIKVKNCVLSKTPDEKIADFTELKKAIHKNGLNDVLFRTSPKVVDE